MNYGLAVVFPLLSLLVLDLFLLVRALVIGRKSGSFRTIFILFVLSVLLQQLCATYSYGVDYSIWTVRDRAFLIFVYSMEMGFMASASYFWLLYLLQTLNERYVHSWALKLGLAFPIVLTLVVSALPLTENVYRLGDDFSFQPGPMKYLQLVGPMLYVLAAFAAAIYELHIAEDKMKVVRMIRYFFLFLIPVFIGVYVQMKVFRGGYTQMGISFGMLFMYLEQYMEEVNENRRQYYLDVISNAGLGLWNIILKEGEKPRMLADDKMKSLLGIGAMGLDEVQTYEAWHARIAPDALDSVNASVARMMDGHPDENTYKWIHPVLGERYVRCGGTASSQADGSVVLGGYHYDVSDNVLAEKRASLIIESLASSYHFLSYVDLDANTYVSAKKGYISNEEKEKSLVSDVRSAVRFTCENLISDFYRSDMLAFSDLSTIDERMAHKHVLISQFKDVRDVWQEWSYIVVDRHDDGTVKNMIWAIRKIEDEKQVELRRQQMLEDNIAANHAKTVFLQNMSHEIRTPLNAMYGFSQLLGMPDGSWSEEEKEQYNDYIHNSYNMLEMLIGDIIDIADAEHGNYRIQIGEVPVNATCRSALMSAEYRKPVGVDMYYTSEVGDDYVIRSDGRRIQQVLVNYLTNACKHTEKGEIHVHCSVKENPGRLTFSVTDTGCGIPADKADVIFNRFTKLNQYQQGSGLGLNICQMVADKLGGEVYLDKSYTGGARFIFVIDDSAVS